MCKCTCEETIDTDSNDYDMRTPETRAEEEGRSMTQHTQGEWIRDDKDLRIVVSRDGKTIAKCFDQKEACEAAENARLIAAAPKLLEALEYARNHVVNPENTDTTDLLKVMTAAIASAHGQQ